MGAVWVAAEMRAGGAYAHTALALDALAATRKTLQGVERMRQAPDAQPGLHSRVTLEERNG